MTAHAPVPPINRTLLKLFAWYARRTLKQNFHSVRAHQTESWETFNGRPLVVYSNHPSWWDPLLGLCLSQQWLGHRKVFAPIDSVALERYRFFAKLGFFGVEQGSLAGARNFLRAARPILQSPDNALWITPEGRLTDPRQRPVELMPGIAHLTRLEPSPVFLPVAVEYPFGLEREPEALAWAGAALDGRELHRLSPAEARGALTGGLEQAMDALATEVLAGRTLEISALFQGRAGTDFFWDLWLRLKALITRQPYTSEHASVTRH